MMPKKIFLFGGDGIGPEVMATIPPFIAFFNRYFDAKITYEHGLLGGSAYDHYGCALSDSDFLKASQCDAILLGAVGGKKWENVPYEHRPEAGLLMLRKKLNLFANLRPITFYPTLAHLSPIKPLYLEGLSLLIVRELTGGVYFGTPKGISELDDGQKEAVDTQRYQTFEIERIARVAFELARLHKLKVTSLDKRNVMTSGVLWHDVVHSLHASEYLDVPLEHMLADSGAMALVSCPKNFGILLTDNLFGDLLSDIAAAFVGSLGLLPSVSLSSFDLTSKKIFGLYEPVHGSAPDLSGKLLANPIGMILSFAMCLKYSLNMEKEAILLEDAVRSTLKSGSKTIDISDNPTSYLNTNEMGSAILKQLYVLSDVGVTHGSSL